MKPIFVYILQAFHAAKGKLTTYAALATAGLNELLASWDQTASILPHWFVTHKQHLVSVAALVAIWTRIRRELSPPK